MSGKTDKPKGDKKRRRALEAYTKLQRAAALSAALVEAAVQPFGLSASQFGVLDTIATRGAVHQQELAEALGRSKAQMTAIIDALESRGLVRRERHAIDRRFITVHLTADGRSVLANATPARATSILALMNELTGEQRVRLTRLCGRLLRVLDPYEDEPGTEGDSDLDDDTSDDSTDESNDRASLLHNSSPDHAGSALSPDSRTDTGS